MERSIENGVLMLAEHTVMVHLDDLDVCVNKVKQHTSDQVALLAAGMREFGWTVPILLDINNNIIAGVGRYLAGRQLELTRVPTVVADHLSPVQVKALIAFDNKINESLWDANELSALMEEIKSEDENALGLTGFDFEEIDDILSGALSDVCDDGEDEKIEKPHFLTVGKHKIEITPEEKDWFTEFFNKWVKSKKSYRGAVQLLIDRATTIKERTDQLHGR